MLENAERFVTEMTKVGLKYREPQDLPNGSTAIACGINGRCNVYEVVFFFDADGHSMSVRVFNLVKVPVDRQLPVIELLNSLNAQYRWIKFYVNPQNDVNIQADAIISSETSGPIAVELLFRIIKIIDDTYPRIMKAVWSD